MDTSSSELVMDDKVQRMRDYELTLYQREQSMLRETATEYYFSKGELPFGYTEEDYQEGIERLVVYMGDYNHQMVAKGWTKLQSMPKMEDITLCY